jgi:hypothetical protein
MNRNQMRTVLNVAGHLIWFSGRDLGELVDGVALRKPN